MHFLVSSLVQQLHQTLKNVMLIMSPICSKPSNTCEFLNKSQILVLASNTQYDLVPLPLPPTPPSPFSLPALATLVSWLCFESKKHNQSCFVPLSLLFLLLFFLSMSSLAICFKMATSGPLVFIPPIFCFLFFCAFSHFDKPYICWFMSHPPLEHQLCKDRRLVGVV